MTQVPPPPGPPWPPPGYPGAPGYPRPRTSGMAIASLVLSLVALVIPVVPAVVGLALGYGARTAIDASGGALVGSGLAKAGRVIGWVAICLATVLVWLSVFALANR